MDVQGLESKVLNGGSKLLSEKLNWTPFYESVSDNPYLSDFYSDMKRWSFNLQIFFLHKRFEMHQKMSASLTSVIQDRTIYEDLEIFARNLYQLGKLSQRDWDNYCGLFKVMNSYLKRPDLIIYLKADTDTLISRIKKRGRDYENSIDSDYLANFSPYALSNDSKMLITGEDIAELSLNNKDIPILHPGPINRGIEISSRIVDEYPNCLINNQVSNGIPIRMALLYLLQKYNK